MLNVVSLLFSRYDVSLPGSHYIVLELESSAAAVHRDLAERLFMAPVISFSRLPREGLGRLVSRPFLYPF